MILKNEPRDIKELSFFVPGTPKTQGSKTAYMDHNANKVRLVNVNNEKLKAWRSDIRNEAQKEAARLAWQMGDKDTPICLRLTFYFRRPSGHYTSKGNYSKNAASYHTKKPDVSKLARAVEDAMTGLIYIDDSQVFSEIITKEYLDSLQDPEGVQVSVMKFVKTELIN